MSTSWTLIGVYIYICLYLFLFISCIQFIIFIVVLISLHNRDMLFTDLLFINEN